MNAAKKSNLFEGLSAKDRILLTTLGSGILGIPASTTIRGSRQQIEAITNVVSATRIFHETLMKSDANLTSVSGKLQEKRVAAENFEKVWGVPWPL